MVTTDSPGVYYQRVDASAPAISALRTDIAGFVGIAARGPLHQALPVQSWRQFQAYFGSFSGAAYLAYAVRAFFENGGQRCWVVRVASEVASRAETVLKSGLDAHWRIAACSPGVWGNDIDISLRETHQAQTLTNPSGKRPESSLVSSVAGFRRATHVRLSQGPLTIYKVVSDVDAVESRLIWMNAKPEARLPYDSALTGFDPDKPILVESIEYTLWVRELGRLTALYQALSLVPEHPRYGPSALGPFRLDRTLFKLPAAPEPVVIEELRLSLGTTPEPLSIIPDQRLALDSGADGLAALSAFDFMGEEIDPLDGDEVKALKTRGLRALEEISEVAILAVPDINIQPFLPPRYRPQVCVPDPCLPDPPVTAAPQVPSPGDLPPIFTENDIYRVQSALIQQCEKLRDRFGLIDPPYKVARDDKLGVGAAMAWRSRFDSKYAAFYYPWLRLVDPLAAPGSLTRDIPPSGHVAGQYAKTDLQIGVHKAPANSALVWVQDVTVEVGARVAGLLNPAGINAIRPLAARGIRVYGARTVSSDTDWLFVNVRRLMMMIEKSIDVATQWAVFEPNDASTRAKIQLVLTSFLLSLWQRGALMGAAPDEAFYVKCNAENNPARERDLGHLLAEVGVAPSRPFEFVILRVGRAHNQFEITEASSGGLVMGAF
ncbi:MAG: phage tail sheath family protein [Blastocatellia bacterium]